MKRIVIGILSVVALAILIGIAFPVYSDRPIPARYTNAVTEARQVALALKMFADDHQGTLPDSFDMLIPHYIPDKQLLRRIWLTTPGTKLDQLPKQAIIAFKLIPEETFRVVVVRPDATVETIRQ
jgi:hypothetical protein